MNECDKCQSLIKSISAERKRFSRKLTVIEALKELLNTKHDIYLYGVKQTIRDLRIQLDSEKAEIRNQLIIAINTTKKLFDERQSLRERLDTSEKELANYQFLSTQSSAEIKRLEREINNLQLKLKPGKRKRTKKGNDTEPDWLERYSLKPVPVASPDEGLDLSDGISSVGSPFSELSCESSDKSVKLLRQSTADLCEKCVRIIKNHHVCEKGSTNSSQFQYLPPSVVSSHASSPCNDVDSNVDSIYNEISLVEQLEPSKKNLWKRTDLFCETEENLGHEEEKSKILQSDTSLPPLPDMCGKDLQNVVQNSVNCDQIHLTQSDYSHSTIFLTTVKDPHIDKSVTNITQEIVSNIEDKTSVLSMPCLTDNKDFDSLIEIQLNESNFSSGDDFNFDSLDESRLNVDNKQNDVNTKEDEPESGSSRTNSSNVKFSESDKGTKDFYLSPDHCREQKTLINGNDEVMNKSDPALSLSFVFDVLKEKNEFFLDEQLGVDSGNDNENSKETVRNLCNYNTNLHKNQASAINNNGAGDLCVTTNGNNVMRNDISSDADVVPVHSPKKRISRYNKNERNCLNRRKSERISQKYQASNIDHDFNDKTVASVLVNEVKSNGTSEDEKMDAEQICDNRKVHQIKGNSCSKFKNGIVCPVTICTSKKDPVDEELVENASEGIFTRRLTAEDNDHSGVKEKSTSDKITYGSSLKNGLLNISDSPILNCKTLLTNENSFSLELDPASSKLPFKYKISMIPGDKLKFLDEKEIYTSICKSKRTSRLTNLLSDEESESSFKAESLLTPGGNIMKPIGVGLSSLVLEDDLLPDRCKSLPLLSMKDEIETANGSRKNQKSQIKLTTDEAFNERIVLSAMSEENYDQPLENEIPFESSERLTCDSKLQLQNHCLQDIDSKIEDEKRIDNDICETPSVSSQNTILNSYFDITVEDDKNIENDNDVYEDASSPSQNTLLNNDYSIPFKLSPNQSLYRTSSSKHSSPEVCSFVNKIPLSPPLSDCIRKRRRSCANNCLSPDMNKVRMEMNETFKLLSPIKSKKKKRPIEELLSVNSNSIKKDLMDPIELSDVHKVRTKYLDSILKHPSSSSANQIINKSVPINNFISPLKFESKEKQESTSNFTTLPPLNLAQEDISDNVITTEPCSSLLNKSSSTCDFLFEDNNLTSILQEMCQLPALLNPISDATFTLSSPSMIQESKAEVLVRKRLVDYSSDSSDGTECDVEIHLMKPSNLSDDEHCALLSCKSNNSTVKCGKKYPQIGKNEVESSCSSLFKVPELKSEYIKLPSGRRKAKRRKTDVLKNNLGIGTSSIVNEKTSFKVSQIVQNKEEEDKETDDIDHAFQNVTPTQDYMDISDNDFLSLLENIKDEFAYPSPLSDMAPSPNDGQLLEEHNPEDCYDVSINESLCVSSHDELLLSQDKSGISSESEIQHGSSLPEKTISSSEQIDCVYDTACKTSILVDECIVKRTMKSKEQSEDLSLLDNFEDVSSNYFLDSSEPVDPEFDKSDDEMVISENISMDEDEMSAEKVGISLETSVNVNQAVEFESHEYILKNGTTVIPSVVALKCETSLENQSDCSLIGPSSNPNSNPVFQKPTECIKNIANPDCHSGLSHLQRNEEVVVQNQKSCTLKNETTDISGSINKNCLNENCNDLLCSNDRLYHCSPLDKAKIGIHYSNKRCKSKKKNEPVQRPNYSKLKNFELSGVRKCFQNVEMSFDPKSLSSLMYEIQKLSLNYLSNVTFGYEDNFSQVVLNSLKTNTRVPELVNCPLYKEYSDGDVERDFEKLNPSNSEKLSEENDSGCKELPLASRITSDQKPKNFSKLSVLEDGYCKKLFYETTISPETEHVQKASSKVVELPSFDNVLESSCENSSNEYICITDSPLSPEPENTSCMDVSPTFDHDLSNDPEMYLDSPHHPPENGCDIKNSVRDSENLSGDDRRGQYLVKKNAQSKLDLNKDTLNQSNILPSHRTMACFGKLISLQYCLKSKPRIDQTNLQNSCITFKNKNENCLEKSSEYIFNNTKTSSGSSQDYYFKEDCVQTYDKWTADDLIISNLNNKSPYDKKAATSEGTCLSNSYVSTKFVNKLIEERKNVSVLPQTLKFNFYTETTDAEMPSGNNDTDSKDCSSSTVIDLTEDDSAIKFSQVLDSFQQKESPRRPESGMITCKTNAFECVLDYWHDYARQNPRPRLNESATFKDLQFLENCVIEIISANTEDSMLERIQSICSKVGHIDSGHIADIIVDAVFIDTGEMDLKYTPPAPPLTPVQRRLLMLLSYLAKGNEEYYLTVIKALEEPVVSFVDKYCINKLSNLVHFHTAVCRHLGLLSRSRAFLYDILYCKGLKIYPLVFSMLPLWIEILPTSEEGKDCLLTQTIVYTLTHYVPHQKSDNYFSNVKQLLDDIYDYNTPNFTRDTLCDLLIDNIRQPGAGLGVVLLCKREEWEWATKIVETKIHPIIAAWIQGQLDKETARQTVLCLGRVVRGYPMNVATNSIKRSRDLLESVLNHQKSIDVTEAAVNSICMLRRHDLFSCSVIFTKWQPIDGKITKNMADNIKTVLSAKQLTYWKKFLTRYN